LKEILVLLGWDPAVDVRYQKTWGTSSDQALKVSTHVSDIDGEGTLVCTYLPKDGGHKVPKIHPPVVRFSSLESPKSWVNVWMNKQSVIQQNMMG
jgi:hypothetical protein